MLNKIFLMMVLVFAISCAEKESDKIIDAQNCLDTLTEYSETTVNTCTAKIASLETKEAYLVRCSANFIIEGFGDPNKFLSAINQLSAKGNTNPTVAMMGVLAFKTHTVGTDASANKTFAANTLEYCKLSGSAGSILIASFVNMATTIVAASATATNLLQQGKNLSQAEMQAALTDLGNSGSEVLGTTAQAAYQASCTSGNESNKDLCATLSASIGTNSDPAAIGEALKKQLKK